MTIDFSAVRTHVKNRFHQNLLWINIQSLINHHVLCVLCAARNFSRSTNWIAIKMYMTQIRNSDVSIQDSIMSTKARVSTIVIIDPTEGNTKNLSAQIATKLLLKIRTWTSTWNSIEDLKEVCKTCRKRFHQRSSLRVHIWVQHPPSTPSPPLRPASPEY